MSLSGSRREHGQRGRQPEEVVRPGDLVDSPSGSAAALIHRRWDEVRAAGHLENPRLEHDRAPVTWHVATGCAVVALLAVGIVTLV